MIPWRQRPRPVRSRRIAFAALALTTIALVVLFWKWIAATVLLWTVGRHAIRRVLGTRPRPRSSWSSLLRSGAFAYAAWNSRWLKPTTHKASVKAKGQPTEEDLDASWM